MDDLALRKADLRAAMQARRAALSPAAVDAGSQAAARHLVAFALGRGVRSVALYAGMKNELDPRVAIPDLAAAGVWFAFPRVVGPRGTPLAFHRTAADARLAPNRLGIPEPDPAWPVVALADLDLLVVPGLAFDLAGGRLGWGGGYYDATLAGSGAICAGFLHSLQLVDAVPRSPTDHPMDFLVSPDGVRPTRG